MKQNGKPLISIVGFICLMIQTACTVGPNYVQPKVNIPFQFKEAKGKRMMGAKEKAKYFKKAEPRDNFNHGEWWKIFHDKTLDDLECSLNSANQSIETAYQNYRQSLALIDEARAAYYPTVSGFLNFTRELQNPTDRDSGLTGSTNNNYTWFLQATWMLDIWGQVRRTVEAAVAGAQANSALLEATRLSMQSSLAQYYFQLRGLDTDQDLLNRTVSDYRHALDITEYRYASGVAPRSDVVQAQTQLETAKALAINNGVLRAQYEHAIAVLIGLPPSQVSLPFHPLTAKPPAVPLVVPSELLERRPDIAQAERLVAQANAQIGVAISAYFPTLTLSGTARTVTQKLFSFPFLDWSLSAELADTIYDGGLRNATVRAAWATYCSTVASYRQVVLTAFQNVEDNLVAVRVLARQSIAQNEAAIRARQAVTLVLNQYKSGTVDYTNVITAQIAAYNAEKTAADLTYQRMTATVGLITALGGGWKKL